MACYRLPCYVDARRQELGLNWVQFAHLCGYRNVNKFVKRFRDFERGGWLPDDRFEKFKEVLGLDEEEIRRIREEERKKAAVAYSDWLEKPIKPSDLVEKVKTLIK